MLELHGAPAFTPARLEKRLATVRATNPGVTGLTATFVHFVDVAAPLATKDAAPGNFDYRDHRLWLPVTRLSPHFTMQMPGMKWIKRP